MYIYHALINAMSTHMIHINLNMIFYTHVEHNPFELFPSFFHHSKGMGRSPGVYENGQRCVEELIQGEVHQRGKDRYPG